MALEMEVRLRPRVKQFNVTTTPHAAYALRFEIPLCSRLTFYHLP
jgi:hypothetical protein